MVEKKVGKMAVLKVVMLAVSTAVRWVEQMVDMSVDGTVVH